MNVYALWKKRDIGGLIAAFSDGDSDVCRSAAESLGKIGEPAVEPLIAALSDKDWRVRKYAAKALGRIGDLRAVEPLITALSDKDSLVRWDDAMALGEIGDPRAVEPLIAALSDKDSNVREDAAKALGKIGDPRAVEPLIAALGDEYLVRRDAANALGKIGEPAVEPLIAALSDGYSRVSHFAAKALGKIGDPRAVEPLIAELSDNDPDVRRNVANALGKIGDLRAIPALEKVIKNYGMDINNSKRSAKVALDKIKSSDAYKEHLREGDTAFISSIESEIAELKSAGVKLHEAEDLLKQAKAELSKNNIEQAKESANKAKSTANERKLGYYFSLKSISEVEAILAKTRARGVVVPNESLTKARHELDQGNYEEATKYAKQSKEDAKRTQEESKPEITIKFPEETFPPNEWREIEIAITNTGSMHAREIEIKPSGDIEFKRIPIAPHLSTNETKTMTIGMKPTVIGNVPIDIVITFKDALDREYISSEEMWVPIAESVSELISINGYSLHQGRSEYKYQVALSFAGEDREYAKGLAELLKEKDISVFYDMYEQADLWGKDNYQHFQLIYRDKAQFCVVFLSHAYAQKFWTRHELESAQARVFRENKEYILPVKIDDTEIPGINETIGYIDLRLVSLEEIADLLMKKLSSQNLEE